MEDDSVEHRAKVFCYYFVRSFEDKLQVYLDILENEANEDVPTSSIPGKGLSGASGAIPFVGKAASILVSEADKFILSKIHKRRSKKFAEFAYSYRDDKDAVQKIILESGLQLFKAFEQQFNLVSTDGGPHRAMQKLALDSVHRYTMYHLENCEENIAVDNILKGILLGTSLTKHLGLIKDGRTLTVDDKDWKTQKIFSKVGMCIVDDTKSTYYSNENTNTKKYGYRLTFSHDDLDLVKEFWEEEPSQKPYEYKLNIDNKLFDDCWEYYIKQYPIDQLKHEMDLQSSNASDDRKEKLEIILQDNQEKHDETSKQLKEIHDNTKQIIIYIEQKSQETSKELNENIEKTVNLIQKLEVATNDNIQETKQELKQQIDVLCAMQEEIKSEEDPLTRLSNNIKYEIDKFKNQDFDDHPDVKNVKRVIESIKNVKDSSDVEKIKQEARRLEEDYKKVEDKVRNFFKF